MSMNFKLLRPKRKGGSAPVSLPLAILFTANNFYTVPSNAVSMKAWAIGSGGVGNIPGGAGGCAFKTSAVSGGSVAILIGAAKPKSAYANGNNTLCKHNSWAVSIIGNGGLAAGGGGSFSGGDGGATGGPAQVNNTVGDYGQSGGSVNADDPFLAMLPCGKIPPVDVSGLFAALALAGVSATASCDLNATFGCGGVDAKFGPMHNAGLGGGGIQGPFFSGGMVGTPSGGGAVVLYFT